MTSYRFTDNDPHTITEIADAYDVDPGTICTLVDQIAGIDGVDMVIADDDGPTITLAHGGTATDIAITPDAVEALHVHLTGTDPDQPGASVDPSTLYDLEDAAAACVDAAHEMDEAMARRDAAVQAAVVAGHKKTEIARRAGISRERLYQILDGRRTEEPGR